MRRAMRHAHHLGIKEPLLHTLTPSVSQLMGSAYPEIPAKLETITEIVKKEEERFLTVLDQGIQLLQKETTSLSKGDKLTGKIAFTLYDT